MATIEQVRDYIRSSVDWSKVYSMIDTLGKTMNGQKDRFDKSDLIEMALEVYSNGHIKYVNKDGVDHVLSDLHNLQGEPTTQEFKFVGNLFYKEFSTVRANKKKGIAGQKQLREIGKTVTLKLVNSMGSSTHTHLPSDYAEFLLAGDNHSMHVIPVADLVPYLNFGGDGIEARRVPAGLFTRVIGPEDITNRRALDDFNYKEEKLKFQRRFLNKF